MARARTLMGENYDVIALIGDGALTGGLAYEGLSDAGQSGEPMVIVLNDNGMSINKNVGGMATLLSKQRVKPGYLHFKRFYRSTVGKAPGLYRVLHHIKEHVKDLVLPNNMFDDMGFYYIGPVDGHDEPQLEKMLRWARDLRQPVLLHVVTQKGRGISYTEQAPEKYHGVSSFDPVTGALPASKPDFSHVFGQTLSQLADEDPTVVAITAAMLTGTGLETFAKAHPERLYDVGIAEGHAITMASGMAKQGLRPVAAIYSSFLQRAYDMLIHDTSLQRLHLVLGVDRAGIVGNDGDTHNGCFDISYLSSVPYMRILCPASFAELRAMLRKAVTELEGPVAIRYPRGGEGAYQACSLEPVTVLREGSDLTLWHRHQRCPAGGAAACPAGNLCRGREACAGRAAGSCPGACIAAKDRAAAGGRGCVRCQLHRRTGTVCSGAGRAANERGPAAESRQRHHPARRTGCTQNGVWPGRAGHCSRCTGTVRK